MRPHTLGWTLLPLLASVLVACGGGGGSEDEGGDSGSVPQHRIVVSAGKGGSISPGTVTVAHNRSAEFRVTPDTGFIISSVNGCAGSLIGNTYVTGAITGDCTVTATFSAAGFTVGGTVSGLDGDLELLLQLANTSEELIVTSSADFVFDTPVSAGESYDVRIQQAPDTQLCRVLNGFGEITAEVRDVAVECTDTSATATVSGIVSAAASMDVDSDINDAAASFTNNSVFSRAQRIHNRITLNGFASATPTFGDPNRERFALTSDPDDIYSVSLQAGQRIRLQVVDYDGFLVDSPYQGDLDLYLFDADGTLVGISETESEFEELLVPASGEYFIDVYAFSGISKYVLRLYPPESSSLAAAGVSRVADFIADEMIIKRAPSAARTIHATQMLSKLSWAHDDHERAVLARISAALPTAGLSKTATAAGPEPAMAELQQSNGPSHAKVRTLRNIKVLRQQPGVVYAEPNYIRQVNRVPNDPGYVYQWHYQSIDLPSAWDVTTAQADADVVVAVIDTGIVLEHEDLFENLLDGYDFISSSERARDGDGIDADPDDIGDSDARGQSSWHGTHVAGIIAAASNNGGGITGIAWGTSLMPIRVIGEAGGTSYDIIQGVRYAAGLSNDSGTVPAKRADIINLSLGGPQGSFAEIETYRAARAAGVILVAAAGNENSSTPSYPAAYEAVISVSATDADNQRAPYSNVGSSITLAAPGGNMAADANGNGYPDGVFSTLADDTSGTRQSDYGFYQGTSMAAPHVAGVVALMKAVYPGLTPDLLDELIRRGALTDDLGISGRDDLYGYGLINAFKAVEIARNLAMGGELPSQPAQVVAEPGIIELASGEASDVVELSNRGGGAPQVTSVVTDVTWLTVTPEATDPDSGLGRYRVTVDRSLLENGFHEATILFSFNNGDQPEGQLRAQLRVPVNVQVGILNIVGQLPPLYVLLLERESQRVLDTVLADAATGAYAFTQVPPGEYLILGGSDIDVDDLVCQSGEACGGYPTLSQQLPVQVAGFDVSGLDFVATILGAFSSTDIDATAASMKENRLAITRKTTAREKQEK